MIQCHAPPLKHEHNCKTIPERVEYIEDEREKDNAPTITDLLRFYFIVVIR
jgi:hypothetical protein